jgi:hypothetical protein
MVDAANVLEREAASQNPNGPCRRVTPLEILMSLAWAGAGCPGIPPGRWPKGLSQHNLFADGCDPCCGRREGMRLRFLSRASDIAHRDAPNARSRRAESPSVRDFSPAGGESAHVVLSRWAWLAVGSRRCGFLLQTAHSTRTAPRAAPWPRCQTGDDTEGGQEGSARAAPGRQCHVHRGAHYHHDIAVGQETAHNQQGLAAWSMSC